MRVLVIGGGGREHAICWALHRSSDVREIICAPGNVGIAQVARTVGISIHEVARLADCADEEKPDLVVIGPEAPLVAGLTDLLESRGHVVFGCSRAAAELEGSKAFAKAFMARHGVPTAAFGVFSDAAEAELFIDTLAERSSERLVVKADGLAQGKGVSLCETPSEAKREVRRLLDDHALGPAGERVVVEEFLVGREASVMALVDGEQVTLLAPAEDHKTIYDGDLGPMTGGMGAISPTPVMDDLTVQRSLKDVLEPTARGLVAEGRPFRGLLYAGLMLTAAGPRVLEFNCRFGDPETQVVLPRLASDFARLLYAVARGRTPERLHWKDDVAVCVVMAARGYPGTVEREQPIHGLDRVSAIGDVTVFHAGTAEKNGQIVTVGGRVLGVTALGASLSEARHRVYAAVELIEFSGAQYRRDIGMRREP